VVTLLAQCAAAHKPVCVTKTTDMVSAQAVT